MNFDWYKLPITLTDFLATGLTSRELIVLFESIGRSQVMISRGNLVSITYKDVNLPVNLPGSNPYYDSGYAAYLDSNQNMWLGVEVVP